MFAMYYLVIAFLQFATDMHPYHRKPQSKFNKNLMISRSISSNILVPSSNTWFLFQYAYILNASSKVAMLTHGQALKSIKNEQPFSFSSQFRKFCNRDMYPFHDTETKIIRTSGRRSWSAIDKI